MKKEMAVQLIDLNLGLLKKISIPKFAVDGWKRYQAEIDYYLCLHHFDKSSGYRRAVLRC